MPGIAQVYKWLHFSLFPPACLLCGDPGGDELDLCPGCRSDLPVLEHPCPGCGRPLPHATGTYCGSCQKKPLPFDACRVPFIYAPPIDYLVQAFKFHRRLEAGRLLAQLLTRQFEGVAPPECLVPVPLHPSRLRERGFNQAVELARPLARQMGVPLETDRCRRIKRTDTQSQLSRDERRRNLKNAFRVDWPAPPRRVAIVDDVLSTGTTAGELARELKSAGVEEVEVWVVARAV